MKLSQRPRRLRQNEAIRRLVAEHQLSTNDLIWPLFVHNQQGCDAIEAMPGVSRLDQESVLSACEQALSLNIPCIALFPVVDNALLSPNGDEAYNEDGLIQQTVKGIKKRFPELLVLVDVALDPYTDHGHDGLLTKDGQIDNDATVEVLIKQALSLAAAGADIVAPSDMMDGRIGAIRNQLEENNFQNTMIMSYAAKYCSSFYGPFREAIGSGDRLKSNKATYQMNPANSKEAITELELDVTQGADMLMIKPGLPYLDIISQASAQFQLPIFAYQVSGEYSMINAAGQNNWIDLESTMLETLLSFKRAGCAGILTYFAETVATLLNKK